MSSSLDLLSDTVREVKRAVEALDKAKTISSLEGLYLQGVELVEKIVLKEPLGLDLITPLVVGLDACVASKTFLDNADIQRFLSKTYRLFIELMLHQRKDIPVRGRFLAITCATEKPFIGDVIDPACGHFNRCKPHFQFCSYCTFRL